MGVFLRGTPFLRLVEGDIKQTIAIWGVVPSTGNGGHFKGLKQRHGGLGFVPLPSSWFGGCQHNQATHRHTHTHYKLGREGREGATTSAPVRIGRSSVAFGAKQKSSPSLFSLKKGKAQQESKGLPPPKRRNTPKERRGEEATQRGAPHSACKVHRQLLSSGWDPQMAAKAEGAGDLALKWLWWSKPFWDPILVGG